LQALAVAHAVRHEVLMVFALHQSEPVKTVCNTVSLVVVVRVYLALARLMESTSLLVVEPPTDLESQAAYTLEAQEQE
jgi:hypothetical protein